MFLEDFFVLQQEVEPKFVTRTPDLVLDDFLAAQQEDFLKAQQELEPRGVTRTPVVDLADFEIFQQNVASDFVQITPEPSNPYNEESIVPIDDIKDCERNKTDEPVSEVEKIEMYHDIQSLGHVQEDNKKSGTKTKRVGFKKLFSKFIK